MTLKACASLGRITGGALMGTALLIGLYFVAVGPTQAIQNIDAILQAGTLQMTNNGTVTWSISTNQGSNLTFQNNNQTTNPTTAMTLDGGNGGVLFPKYPKASVDALTPAFLGEIILVTGGTISPTLCISTGTAIDQWSAYGTQTGQTARGCGANN